MLMLVTGLCFWLAAAERMSRASGQPVCPRCSVQFLTPLVSSSLLAAWSEAEGEKWQWRGKTAFWLYCLSCHRLCFGHDGRTSNRHSKPKPVVAASRLPVGELLVTRAPEERTAAPPLAPRKPRKRKVTWSDGGFWSRAAAASAGKPRPEVQTAAGRREGWQRAEQCGLVTSSVGISALAKPFQNMRLHYCDS